ncbi:hypothetical protein LTS10_006326 [Elasticomyces elasticus]|nr:hypothetical protein LTS10_006326 [Elasticomyces elasticus]
MSFDIIERTEAKGDDQPFGEWFDIATATGGSPYNAYGPYYGPYGFLQLYDTGCRTGYTTWNCTAACLDTDVGPSMVWNDSASGMYTLQNCVVLPVIAALLASSSLTPAAVAIAGRYEIAPDASLINGVNGTAWPVLSNCFNEYCEANGEGTPGCNSTDNPDVVPLMFTTNETHFMDGDGRRYSTNFTIAKGAIPAMGLCHNLNAVINGDIGGIGMFVSYMMQMMIVLSAWVLFHFYENWAAWPLTLFMIPVHGRKRATQLAQQAQNTVRASNHNHALVAALDEMQKAQVFFMLGPDPDKSIKYEGAPIPQCAGIAPIKYCYQYGWADGNSIANISAVPMLVLICLIVDAMEFFTILHKDGHTSKGSLYQWLEWKVLGRPFWTTYDEKHFNKSRWLTLMRLDSGARIVQLAQSFILFATEIVFVGLNIVLIKDYSTLLLANDFQTLNLKDWTLGQVISVTIWVPVFLEYIYTAAGGPEETHKGRLHRDFEVVRKPTEHGDPFDDEKADTVSSSAVELTHMDPVTRPGYERVNSNAWN